MNYELITFFFLDRNFCIESTILEKNLEKIRKRGANFTSLLATGARNPRYATECSVMYKDWTNKVNLEFTPKVVTLVSFPPPLHKMPLAHFSKRKLCKSSSTKRPVSAVDAIRIKRNPLCAQDLAIFKALLFLHDYVRLASLR